MSDWQVLIVDDEPDVRSVTKLALRAKRWRNRAFHLIHAESAAEAREILAKPDTNIQVAMIDVVMETDRAGLELCDYIREHHSRSLRIILRTGQAGVAPEAHVLNEYDIDYYLAKSEATPDRLFALIRASLRASMDIETFMSLKDQLATLVDCFRNPTSPKELALEMKRFLARLETKYTAKMTFFANAHTDTEGSELFRQAVRRAIATNTRERYVQGDAVGLDAKHFVVPFSVDVTSSSGPAPKPKGLFRGIFGAPPVSAAMQPIEGGLVVSFDDTITTLERRDFLHEFNLALGQWKLAYGVLCVQQDVAFRRVFEERARRQRIESLR